jgi:hypothetical protein
VFASDTATFKIFRDYLIANNCEKFFTHQLREEQLTKIVLHGMYDMELSDLKELLNEVGIKPTEIKKMSIHQKRYSDHCLYLLLFNKSEKVKISTLRETLSLNYVRVRWEYFQNRRLGPIQCTNCMSYGHGSKYCHLDPICIRCANNHASKDCPHLVDPVTNAQREKIPDNLVKCGLCGQNHTANYTDCVKRVEFMERQERYRRKTQRRQPPIGQQPPQYFQNAPQLSNFHLPNNNNAPRESSVNDLFSAHEIMPILSELMNALQGARSKQQQFLVIAEMAVKYCYGRN